LTEKLRHYSRKKRKSENYANRKSNDVSSKYLKPQSKRGLAKEKGQVIDYKTFDAVQNKLKISSNNDIHRTSPLNNIKLDFAWKEKDNINKSNVVDGSKFFLSRQEKKPRYAHKNINDHEERNENVSKENKKIEVRRLDLRAAKSNSKNYKIQEKEANEKKKNVDTLNFMSSRIQKEFYMSIEIKRLNRKLIEMKNKSEYK
jgi:hypothetical protein